MYSYSECIDRYGLKADYFLRKVTIENPRRAQADGMLRFLASHKAQLLKEMEIRQYAGRPESVIDGIRELERMLMYKMECEDSEEMLEIERRLQIMQRRYPRATAYVKAKMWAYSKDIFVSVKGLDAAKRIVAGENYQEVLADVGEQIKRYLNNSK